jgi:hypothetical protein
MIISGHDDAAVERRLVSATEPHPVPATVSLPAPASILKLSTPVSDTLRLWQISSLETSNVSSLPSPCTSSRSKPPASTWK